MTTEIQYGQYVVPSSDKMVNFGVGQPSNKELPLEIIKKASVQVSELNDDSVLQYGDIPGYYEFRKVLGKFLENRYSEEVNPDNLFITNGVTGALSLICSLYISKCKKIYVEEPTYFLAINIFKEFGFSVESIPMKEDGIDLNLLEKKLANDSNEIKLLYTIPSFHNPSSITMSDKKRLKLSELSYEHNIHIIADEVYQMLYFKEEDKPPKPLHYYCENVFSLSSFSKILAPSLRLGWIQTSDYLMDLLKSCGQLDSSGGINPFISRIVHNVIQNGDLDSYLDKMRKVLYERCNTLCENLDTGSFVKPKGGYFVWLDTDVNTLNMLNYCNDNKVKYHSGNKFSGNNSLENYIRLSFSFYDLEGLKIGANRLNEAYKYYNENKNKIFVSVFGESGKLGSKITNLINQDKSYVFNKVNRTIDYKPGIGKNVIIDVTSPEGTKNLIQYLLENNYSIPLIIGTTGNLPMNEINLYAELAPVAIISNFSYGIPLLEKVLKNIDFSNWNITIEETHHTEKKDSPSGTAKSLANIIGNVSNIESIREGDVFGMHKIKLENESEILEFNHVAKNRDIFATGCLRYINWIYDKIPDIYYDLEEKKVYIEKWNGCGNTFVIIDEKYSINFNQTTKNGVKKLCNDTKSDGIIYYKILNNEEYDFEWKYINRDESVVEMCGNGARCISKYIENKIKKSNLKFKNNFNIEQTAIVKGDYVEVVMPRYKNYKQGFEKEGYFIEVGVPHYVLKVPNVNSFDLRLLYTEINNKLAANYILSVSDINNTSKFDITWEKCNVNIYHIKDGVCHIRTFEKGVEQETGACGSGCCAVFYEINKSYKTSKTVEFITSSKDKLAVQKKGDDIYLSSKVSREFRAYI